ncbi:hypothetical protein ACLBOM_21375 [Escherichia coli]
MEKTENKPIVIGADAAPFKFELSQLVEMRISDEWGEVKARAQYADGENQYLIHYKAADGRATTEWFGESMLEATEDDRHPGCPVFAGMKLPEGAVVNSRHYSSPSARGCDNVRNKKPVTGNSYTEPAGEDRHTTHALMQHTNDNSCS